MFEFFPTNYTEFMRTYDSFRAELSGNVEDFKVSQRLYNQLSDLNKNWIWMLGAGVGNDDTMHLAGLFHSTASASDRIEFLILETDMTDEPVLFCYYKPSGELIGDFIVPDNYEATEEHDEQLLDLLYLKVREWKEYIPNALN